MIKTKKKRNIRLHLNTVGLVSAMHLHGMIKALKVGNP